MRPNIMRAKRASICPACAVPIPIGGKIGRHGDGRWGHVDCRANALTLTAARWHGSPVSGRWLEPTGAAADAARAYLAGEARPFHGGTRTYALPGGWQAACDDCGAAQMAATRGQADAWRRAHDCAVSA